MSREKYYEEKEVCTSEDIYIYIYIYIEYRERDVDGLGIGKEELWCI